MQLVESMVLVIKKQQAEIVTAGGMSVSEGSPGPRAWSSLDQQNSVFSKAYLRIRTPLRQFSLFFEAINVAYETISSQQEQNTSGRLLAIAVSVDLRITYACGIPCYSRDHKREVHRVQKIGNHCATRVINRRIILPRYSVETAQ